MRNVLVIAAHSSDFVWRCSGALALASQAGGECTVLALSFGERGESGELWNQPAQTVENVKRVRADEAQRAATAVGARFESLDLGDYPLRVDDAVIERIVERIRALRPHVMITHTQADPFNPDHPVAHAAAVLARQLCVGAGVASAFQTVQPPELLLFEPHQPELCGFAPTTFLDITSVYERKQEAMGAMTSQGYLRKYYSERAEHRANHARRVSGNTSIKFAEAFQRVLPQVVSAL